MRSDYFHAREKVIEIGGDHLLEPDEIMLVGNRPIFADSARRTLDRQKARQGIGHFQARKFFVALFVADHDGEVQTQIRNMREWMTWVKRERCEHWIDHFFEIRVSPFFLSFV